MSLIYAYLLVQIIEVILYREQKPLFLAFLRNARLPQLCYHTGLTLLGIAAAVTFAEKSFELTFFNVFAVFLLTAATNFAWLASVVVNDRFDKNIDKITNPKRPLPANTIDHDLYDTIGIILFVFSLLFGGILSFKILLLILSYQAIAWIYSAPPFRLKRFPFLGTFLTGCASLLIFLSGFTLLEESSISAIPTSLLFFILATCTITFTVKDFKDIEGDRADHIWTLPVLLGEKYAKLFVGSMLFLFFIGSVFLIRDRALFLPAVIFGSAAFFLLQYSSRDHPYFSYRRLIGWEVAVIGVYSACVAFLLF
jgi:chlorophyll synthase